MGKDPARLPPALVQVHKRNNADTAASWERFAGHRTRVTELLRETMPPGGAIAVLGAGNCNDLELASIAEGAAMVHLIDLDSAAVARAISRLPETLRPRVRANTPVDLSGAMDRLPGWRTSRPTHAQLATLPGMATARVLDAVGAGAYDVVASTCFLSQLMDTCAVALGKAHSHIHLVASALALAHLRSMTAMARPGGTCLLVTDMVSSDTYPLDDLFPERNPMDLLAELAATDNAFSGTNVLFVEHALRSDAEITARALAPEVVPPWLWHFTAERTYLVYAARWRVRA